MMIWACCRPAAPTKRPPAPLGRARSLAGALTRSLALPTLLFRQRGGRVGLDLAVVSGCTRGIVAAEDVEGGCRGEQGAEAIEPGSQKAQAKKERLREADRQQGPNHQDLKPSPGGAGQPSIGGPTRILLVITRRVAHAAICAHACAACGHGRPSRGRAT